MDEKNVQNYTVIATAYDSCTKCCGKSDGITKMGTKATAGRTVAVDPEFIPLGTKIYIEGYGWFTAEDTGGKIKKNHIDIYVANHEDALKFGVKKLKIYVMK